MIEVLIWLAFIFAGMLTVAVIMKYNDRDFYMKILVVSERCSVYKKLH